MIYHLPFTFPSLSERASHVAVTDVALPFINKTFRFSGAIEGAAKHTTDQKERGRERKSIMGFYNEIQFLPYLYAIILQYDLFKQWKSNPIPNNVNPCIYKLPCA